MEDVKTFFPDIGGHIVTVVFTIFSSGSATVDDISYQIAIHLGNWPSDDAMNGCYHGMSIILHYIPLNMHPQQYSYTDLPNCDTSTLSQIHPQDMHCFIGLSMFYPVLSSFVLKHHST